MGCPRSDELRAYRDGSADETARTAIQAHLWQCEACAADVTCDRTALTVSEKSGGASSIPGAGETVGRYVILRLLGEGGMGTVCLAYDPDLDRKVALKFLRAGMAHWEHRLLREAQAMAHLPHPNIVPVHDVGTHRGLIFIAMEFVDGSTVSEWLKQQRRSVRAILDVFLAAGRGLAAAHAAGLVHRDFKPSNLLLGKDGRVLVTDFGLVRSSGAAGEASLDDRPPGDEPDSPTSVRLPARGAATVRHTDGGALLGTPPYMAPEQFRPGGIIDARTDEFSFCVSLYQALYGELPFKEHVDGVGVPREPGRGARVPAWIRRILVRGLAPDRAARFASMTELLAALERDPAVARRRWAGAAGVCATIAAAALIARAGGARDRQLCAGSDGEIASAWSPARATAVRAAFVANGASFGARAADSAIAALDDYARRWAEQAKSACVATRVRGDQSEELLDLRMQCLAERRQELGAVVDQLAAPDRDTVARSLRIAGSLSPLDDCANARLLKEPIKPPALADERAKVEALRGRVARARGLDDAGKYSAALAALRAVADDAHALGYLPVEAEVLYQLGRAQDHVGDAAGAAATLQRAITAAEEGRHDRVVTDAAIDLVRVLSELPNQLEASLAWAEHAAAWTRRIGAGEATVSRLQHNLALVQFRRGQYDVALASFGEAVRMSEKVYGPAHPGTLESLGELANTYEAQGKRLEAVQIGRRVVQAIEGSLGPDHPAMGTALVNLGVALGNQGDMTQALAMYRRALSIYERALPPDHPFIAMCLLDLGESYVGMGMLDEGLATAERALAMERRLHGSLHPEVAIALCTVGEMRGLRGDWTQALAAEREALSIQEKVLGANHPDLADTLIAVARAELELHQRDGARRDLGRALSLPVSDARIKEEAKKLQARL